MPKSQTAPKPLEIEDPNKAIVDQMRSSEVDLPKSQAASIPAHEAWLYNNAEALASVRRGLDDAANNRTVSLGSFEGYADLEIDD